MIKEGGVYYVRTGFFEHLQERIRVDRLYTQRLGEMTEDEKNEAVQQKTLVDIQSDLKKLMQDIQKLQQP